MGMGLFSVVHLFLHLSELGWRGDIPRSERVVAE